MKTTPRKASSGFTLIELMAVVTIIVILAALVVGGLGYVTEKQATSKAKVQIALISKALEDYKLDNGTYPLTGNTTGGTNQTASLYQALFYEGYDYNKQTSPPDPWTKKVNGVDFPKSTKIYIADLDPTSTKQGWVDLVTGDNPTIPPTTTIKDPWGREYAYRTAAPQSGNTPNADTQNPDFDIWSYGKDGKTNADPNHKDSLDDIRNF